jgi:hypothetical protein
MLAWVYRPRTRRAVAWIRWRLINAEVRSAVGIVRRSGVFDGAFYVQRYPDVVSVGEEPIDHYVKFGIWENRDPSPLFSCGHYLDQVGHVTGMPAMLHFALVGDAAGRSPNWLFDTTWYRARYIRDERWCHTALFHYLAHHRKQRLWTHALFDSSWFAERHVHQIPQRTSPLAFYLGAEGAWRLTPNPLFDPEWYLRHYSIASTEPLRHYIEHGDRMGLAPHPLLSGRRLSLFVEEN